MGLRNSRNNQKCSKPENPVLVVDNVQLVDNELSLAKFERWIILFFFLPSTTIAWPNTEPHPNIHKDFTKSKRSFFYLNMRNKKFTCLETLWIPWRGSLYQAGGIMRLQISRHCGINFANLARNSLCCGFGRSLYQLGVTTFIQDSCGILNKFRQIHFAIWTNIFQKITNKILFLFLVAPFLFFTWKFLT